MAAPHSVPVWIAIEGDNLRFSLARDHERIATSSATLGWRSRYDVDQPYASVLIRGQVVEVVDGDRAWGSSIGSAEVHRPALSIAHDRIVLLIKPDHAQAVNFG